MKGEGPGPVCFAAGILCLFVFLAVPVALCLESRAQNQSGKRKASRTVLFREDFRDMSQWEPLFFPKIEKHTHYTIERKDGLTYLKAESSASASALVFRHYFDVYRFPWIRFRILVKDVYEKGDAEKKSGDDYPFRIYVMFKYDPAMASFWQQLKYNSARLVYGKYPPFASINYIWANRQHEKRILTSTYTERAKMIPVDYGSRDLGTWKEFQVNVLADYKKAFGKEPPRIAQIAVMSDSDNTGESGGFLMDFVEVSDRPYSLGSKQSLHE